MQYWRMEKQVRLYLEEVAAICYENNYKNPHNKNSSKERTRKIFSKAFVVFLILTFKLLHSIYLCLVQLDDFHRWLHYDLMLFWNCRQFYNIFNISLSLQLWYFVYRIYWHARDRRMAIPLLQIRRVLYFGDNRYFLEKHLTKRNGEKELASDRVKRYIKIYQRCFSYSVMFFCKSNIFSTKKDFEVRECVIELNILNI